MRDELSLIGNHSYSYSSMTLSRTEKSRRAFSWVACVCSLAAQTAFLLFNPVNGRRFSVACIRQLRLHQYCKTSSQHRNVVGA